MKIRFDNACKDMYIILIKLILIENSQLKNSPYSQAGIIGSISSCFAPKAIES